MPQADGTIRYDVEADASNLANDLTRQTKGQAEKSGSTIGGLLGKGLKFGATAAAGGIAAILTGAFVKGFGRLASIDQAQAKLKGLGITGKDLQTVMDNALAAVQDTAYGLDEAVAPIPGLLAAGVKPGKDLEQALTNMASAATLGGTNMADMAQVFGDAAASSGSLNDVFNRMEQRGIPALSLVAEHMGLTREEAKKMSSEGKISFQQFQDALTAGIGPAAVAAGGSFQGMLANIMTALGKIGAVILGPIFEGIKSIMPGILEAFRSLQKVIEPIVAEAGPGIAAMFSDIKAAIDGIDWNTVATSLGKVVQAFIDWAPAIWAVVGAFVAFQVIQGVNAAITFTTKAIQAAQAAMAAYRAGMSITTAINAGLTAANFATAASVWASTVAFLASPVTWIVVGIIALIAAIILLWLNWDKVTKFLQETWANFIGWFQGVMDGFLGWWDGVWASVMSVIDAFMAWWGPIWAAIAAVFMDIWAGIVSFFEPIFSAITTIIRVYIEIWMNVFLVLRAVFKVIWDAIVAVFTAAWNAIVEFVTPIIKKIQLIITVALGIIRALWTQVWGAISGFFTTIWNKIVSVLTPIINKIKLIISVALGVIRGTWSTIWGAISGVFKGIWDGITGALNAAIGVLLGVFRTLKQKIMAPLAGAASWLVGVGRDIINGMVNGIKGMIDNVIGAIGDVVNGAIDWAKNILGEASPSKVFATIGKDLGQGFVNGVDAMAGDVQEAVGSLTAGAVEVAGNVTASVAPSAAAAQGYGALQTGAVTNVNVAEGAFALSGADPYRVSKSVVDRLAERSALVTA